MRAIFLDKDGTLIHDVPYNVDPDLIHLSFRAAQGLRIFRRLGYALFVITNQPGVARGLFDESALPPVHRRLQQLLAEQDVALDGFYYCPHDPHGCIEPYAIDCNCRKPGAGMIERAAQEHGIDLGHSWTIGDILNDVEAGRRAGCKTVLIDNGNETEWLMTPDRIPHLVAPNLYAAAQSIAQFEEVNNGFRH